MYFALLCKMFFVLYQLYFLLKVILIPLFSQSFPFCYILKYSSQLLSFHEHFCLSVEHHAIASHYVITVVRSFDIFCLSHYNIISQNCYVIATTHLISQKSPCIIDGFTTFMHTILTKVVQDNLKPCLRFVWCSNN